MESLSPIQEYKCKPRYFSSFTLSVITSKYNVDTQYIFAQKEYLSFSVKILACTIRKEIYVNTTTQVAIIRICLGIL